MDFTGRKPSPRRRGQSQAATQCLKIMHSRASEPRARASCGAKTLRRLLVTQFFAICPSSAVKATSTVYSHDAAKPPGPPHPFPDACSGSACTTCTRKERFAVAKTRQCSPKAMQCLRFRAVSPTVVENPVLVYPGERTGKFGRGREECMYTVVVHTPFVRANAGTGTVMRSKHDKRPNEPKLVKTRGALIARAALVPNAEEPGVYVVARLASSRRPGTIKRVISVTASLGRELDPPLVVCSRAS